MSDFILEYDMLESIAAYSKSLGKRAGEYEESLEKKMISGIASITGPSTGYLQSASDSVRDKANALKQKSDVFYHYAEQITNLLETAERIDQEVADAITAQREYFLDHHKSLRLDDWKAKLLGLLVDLKNSIPLLGTIADLLEGLNTVIESLEDSIRHWYECEGGKYVIGEIAAVAEACLAVAIFAATFPISTFTGFCLAVGFGIAALNSCVNVKTSYKAAEAAMDGNPALAEIYGKQDTLSDVLRQKNYGNGTMNDLSNFTAGALDVTEAVCITVGMAGQIVNLFKKSYNLLKYRKSLNYSSLQNNLESGSVKLENVIKEEYKNIKNIGLADDTGAVGELEKSADLIKGSGQSITNNSITDGTRVGSATKPSDGQHGFPDIIDNYAKDAVHTQIVGGDGITRDLYQIEGGYKYYDDKILANQRVEVNGTVYKMDVMNTKVSDSTGIFEWIKEPNGNIAHRRFIPGGKITGYPNQITNGGN